MSANGVQSARITRVRCRNANGVRVDCGCPPSPPSPPPPPPCGTCAACDTDSTPGWFTVTFNSDMTMADCATFPANLATILTSLAGKTFCLMQDCDAPCVYRWSGTSGIFVHYFANVGPGACGGDSCGTVTTEDELGSIVYDLSSGQLRAIADWGSSDFFNGTAATVSCTSAVTISNSITGPATSPSGDDGFNAGKPCWGGTATVTPSDSDCGGGINSICDNCCSTYTVTAHVDVSGIDDIPVILSRSTTGALTNAAGCVWTGTSEDGTVSGSLAASGGGQWNLFIWKTSEPDKVVWWPTGSLAGDCAMIRWDCPPEETMGQDFPPYVSGRNDYLDFPTEWLVGVVKSDCASTPIDICANTGSDDCANTVHVSVTGGSLDGFEADITRTDTSTHTWGDPEPFCSFPCAYIECIDGTLTLTLRSDVAPACDLVYAADGTGECPTGRTWTLTIPPGEGCTAPTSVSVT